MSIAQMRAIDEGRTPREDEAGIEQTAMLETDDDESQVFSEEATEGEDFVPVDEERNIADDATFDIDGPEQDEDDEESPTRAL